VDAEEELGAADWSKDFGADPAPGAPPNAAYDASGTNADTASAIFTNLITLLQKIRSEHVACGRLMRGSEKS
jgi:hypothetical protein